MPYDEILYLDVSLFIRRDLSPLLETIALGSKDFITHRNQRYDCINSCLMWIRKSPLTQMIWDTYASGKRYDTVLDGDQDYIHAVLKEYGDTNRIGYFNPAHVASFKTLLRTHRHLKARAQAMIDEALIIKFSGHPKPHDIAVPLRRFKNITLRYPGHAVRDWGFLADELREHWR